jgi:hypothetical protein
MIQLRPIIARSMLAVVPALAVAITACNLSFPDDDDDVAGVLDDDDAGGGCSDGTCVYLDPDYACQCNDDCCEVECAPGGPEGSCAVACAEETACAVQCDGMEDCAVSCPSAESCAVDCTGTDTCTVNCSEQACDVDCGDTGSCAVNCHESGCVVHNCDLPMYCVVTCGDGGLPTQSGDDWVCP